ncbi:MAG: HAD hydrolase-like protein [Phycisphaerales bacterium]|nr:HAD hydrolase-like protein [Phycisphaerales bacterium]
MLILFDIDATLLTTKGAGVRAMVDAGKQIHGQSFHSDGIDFAGRLDPLILADLLAANGIPPTADALAAMRRVYAGALARRLADGDTSRPLPGVMALLTRVTAMTDRCTTGLLTGNFAETGSMKLQAAGIDPDGFAIRVWGDDSPHHPPARDHLPGVAIQRAGEAWGRPARGDEVVVIGDTPHDIACARAHGCRAIAVATGKFTTDDLAHADLTLDTLADTDRVMNWLFT